MVSQESQHTTTKRQNSSQVQAYKYLTCINGRVSHIRAWLGETPAAHGRLSLYKKNHSLDCGRNTQTGHLANLFAGGPTAEEKGIFSLPSSLPANQYRGSRMTDEIKQPTSGGAEVFGFFNTALHEQQRFACKHC